MTNADKLNGPVLSMVLQPLQLVCYCNVSLRTKSAPSSEVVAGIK